MSELLSASVQAQELIRRAVSEGLISDKDYPELGEVQANLWYAIDQAKVTKP